MNPMTMEVLRQSMMAPPAPEAPQEPDPRMNNVALGMEALRGLQAALAPEAYRPQRQVVSTPGLDTRTMLVLQNLLDERYDREVAQGRYDKAAAERRMGQRQEMLMRQQEMEMRKREYEDRRADRLEEMKLRREEIAAKNAPKPYSPRYTKPGMAYQDEQGNWHSVPSNPIYEAEQAARAKRGTGRGGSSEAKPLSPSEQRLRLNMLQTYQDKAQKHLEGITSEEDKKVYVRNHNLKIEKLAKQLGVPIEFAEMYMLPEGSNTEGKGIDWAAPFRWLGGILGAPVTSGEAIGAVSGQPQPVSPTSAPTVQIVPKTAPPTVVTMPTGQTRLEVPYFDFSGTDLVEGSSTPKPGDEIYDPKTNTWRVVE